MVGVGLSTKDDNLRNDRWKIIIRKDVRIRLFITALLDDKMSITDTDDDSYETEDNYYYYFLLNVITFILLQHITIFCMIIIVLE